jgi:hypothetical protein
MGIHMPVMWGTRPLLIALTSVDDCDASLQANFDFHLMTPVDVERLLQLLMMAPSHGRA